MERQLNTFVNAGSDEALVKSLDTSQSSNPAFYQVVCAGVLFTNDMKHIHLHIYGKQFDRIHTMTQEYYEKASEDTDYLAELAMEYGQQVPNFSLAGQMVPWDTALQNRYGYDEAVAGIFNAMALFISKLTAFRNQPELASDAQSKLDDMLRYWKKELAYKMEHRVDRDIQP